MMVFYHLLLFLQVQQVFGHCDEFRGGYECDPGSLDQVRVSKTGQSLLQLQSLRRSLLAPRRREGSLPLTFKHFAKAGGTFVQAVLEDVIPNGLLESANETQSLTPENTDGRFVLGGIRNPCEYYPSLWVHMMSEKCLWGQGCYMTAFPQEDRAGLMPTHREPPFDSPEDLRRFRAFLQSTSSSDGSSDSNISSSSSSNSSLSGDLNLMSLRFWSSYVRLREEDGQHQHRAERATARQYLDVEMDPLERQQVLDELAAYDPDHSAVSCWMRVESLNEDLRRCLQLYVQQGGEVLWDKLDATMNSSTHYTSPHSPCSVYYDNDTRAAVRQGDAAIFEKFGYSSCCEEQKEQNQRQMAEVPGAGRLTLVTGASGSGTGLLARVLCQAYDTLCIPGGSGWTISQLAPSVQQVYLDMGLSRHELRTQSWTWRSRSPNISVSLEEMEISEGRESGEGRVYTNGDKEELLRELARAQPGGRGDRGETLAKQISLFNRALWLLWQDADGRPYIEQSRDTRDPNLRSWLLDSLAHVARQWLLAAEAAGHPAQQLILERSMPFAGDTSRSHSPFFEDLKDLAARISPAWSADVNLILRDPPRAWHTSEDESDSAPFLTKVEQLAAKAAAGEGADVGVPVSVVTYNALACDPSRAMVQLGLHSAAADTLLSSPELTPSSRISFGAQHTSVDYLKGLARRRQLWELQDPELYPNLHHALEDSLACCGRNRQFYIVPLLIVIASCLGYLIPRSGPGWLRLQLQILSYYDVFFVHLQYSAGIPMAYDLSITLQRDKAYSGFLIGSFWGCVGVGSLFLARPFVSTATQPMQRFYALCGISVLVACSFLYALSANPPGFWDISQEQQAVMLVILRMLCGLAWSVSTMVVSCMAVRVTPKQEQVGNEVARSLFTTLGTGCGPLLNVLPTPRGDTNFTGEAAAQPLFLTGLVGLGFLVMAWAIIPVDAKQLDAAKGDKDTVSASTLSLSAPTLHRWQIVVFVCGSTLGVLRAWLSGALEAAGSLVLETDFGWTTGRVGLAMGCVLLLAAAVIQIFLMLRARLGDTALLLLGSGTSLVTSTGLAVLVHFVKSPWIFVLADLLVFPSSFIASSVAEGMVMSYAVPGTFCSMENAWVIRNALKCNVGRFLGPLTARSTLAAGGQTLCTAVQALLTVAICILGCCQLAAVPDKDRCYGRTQQLLLDNGTVKGKCGGENDEKASVDKVPGRSRRVRLAICGLGRVADFYLENIATNLSHRIELVAGADPKAAMRSKLPPGAAAEENMAGLLRHRPDAVVVCVPTPLHTQVTSQVLEAKIPVLLEKPAATCMQELEGLYAKSERPLHVALHGQHADEVLWMAENLASFGELLEVEAKFFDDYLKGEEVSDTMLSLASSWLDSGVNALACLFAALGQSVILTSLHEEPMLLAGHKLNVAAHAEIKVGTATGRILTDWRLGRSEKTITLRFKKSTVVLQMVKRLVLVDGEVVKDFSRGPARMVGRYSRVLCDFLKALESGTSNQRVALEVHRQLLDRMHRPPGQQRQ